MNILPQFVSFMDDLRALIEKHYPGGATSLSQSKHLRQREASRMNVDIYSEQFGLIVAYVCNDLDLNTGLVDQSVRRCRFERVAWARQLCMVLCHELTEASTLTIAQYFNATDHGTVVYAKGRIAERCAERPNEAELLARLRVEVKQCLDMARNMRLLKRERVPLPPPQYGPPDHQQKNPILAFLLQRMHEADPLPSPNPQSSQPSTIVPSPGRTVARPART